MTPRLRTLDTVAEEIGISRRHLARMIRDHKIPVAKFGTRTFMLAQPAIDQIIKIRTEHYLGSPASIQLHRASRQRNRGAS